MSKQQYIEQLFETMGQLKKLLQNQATESHEDRAATVMQYSALKFLNEHKISTVGDMADYLKLSKSSATQLVERLVKAELVNRVHDTKDRRIVRLDITGLGVKEIGALKKKFTDRMNTIFAKIPEGDLRELVRIQRSLIETLQGEQS